MSSWPRREATARLMALLGGAGLGAFGLAGTSGLRAQPSQTPVAAFPSRPLVCVVPFAAGGIADLCARALAGGLASALGQPVLIENKPGAGAIAGTQAVVHAKPDGHTLLLLSNANALSVGLFPKLPFDPRRDLAAVGLLGLFDLGLFVAASSAHASLREWLAHAQRQPGKLSIGCISPGSTQHLAAEWLRSLAGVDVVIVNYKATPALLTALRGGEIDLAIEILGPWLPQISGGLLRALAVTGPQAHPLLPGVGSAHESGLAGFQVASWNGLAVPAGTPAGVITRLNQAMAQALSQPAVLEPLNRLGVSVRPGPPQALQQLLASEIERWTPVIRRAGVSLGG